MLLSYFAENKTGDKKGTTWRTGGARVLQHTLLPFNAAAKKSEGNSNYCGNRAPPRCSEVYYFPSSRP